MDKQLSCLTRESDGREKAMDARRLQKLLCGRWSPENRGCRRQTPLLTQTPDALKYFLWTLDAYNYTPHDARRQTYSPPPCNEVLGQGFDTFWRFYIFFKLPIFA